MNVDDKMDPLKDIGKANYYKVPDNYFEELPMRVQSRISTRNVSDRVWVPMIKYAIPAVLILVMSYLAIQPNKKDVSNEYLAQITLDEALNYLSTADINTQEFIDLTVADDELDEIIKAPTVDELFAMEEELLETIDWGLNEDEETIESL